MVAVSDGVGNLLGGSPNRYDEYGVPQGGALTGRFGYTGQAWIPEIGMYHYRTRIYSPTLGRFLQTDPIGYGDGMNLYAYVRNDPVNFIDPSGTEEDCNPLGCVDDPDIEVTGSGIGGIAWIRMGGPTGILPNTLFAGGDGGSSGGTPRENPNETPTCKAIRERVNATRGNLSSSITNSERWNRMDFLNNDRTTAQMNEADAMDLRWVVYALTGAGTAGRAGTPRGGLWGTMAVFVVGVIGSEGLGAYVAMHRAEIAALEARLAQLQAQADGTCPA